MWRSDKYFFMCGILGVLYADSTKSAVAELLEGCHYLQHRGQDAAGITTSQVSGRLHQCKGNGMVRDVFLPSRIDGLVGPMGVAHLRYPTAGTSSNSEAQPFYVNSPYGLVITHNGNLTNAPELKEYMDTQVHRHINTDSDSELLLNVVASKLQETNKRRLNEEDLVNAIGAAYSLARGAFSCVMMLAGYGLVAFRDADGIRPLCFGTRTTPQGPDFMFASENVVLEALGYKNTTDVLPGQAVIVHKGCKGPFIKQIVAQKSYSPCIFEYVYFARPDSVIDGISVYRARLALGTTLAKNIIDQVGSLDKVRELIDVVIPVPDTANPCALSVSSCLKIPYREGFVKNRYVGRTFIMPNQTERRSSVRRKLNANINEFEGQRVLLVDDSIVRGTTSLEIVQMAREAGARSVYFASCAPPIRHNHIYGIDLADSTSLVAYKRSNQEICKEVGCDDIFYQTVEDMEEACRMAANRKLDITGFEVGVFTGQYITGLNADYFETLKEMRNGGATAKAETDIGIFNHCL